MCKGKQVSPPLAPALGRTQEGEPSAGASEREDDVISSDGGSERTHLHNRDQQRPKAPERPRPREDRDTTETNRKSHTALAEGPLVRQLHGREGGSTLLDYLPRSH